MGPYREVGMKCKSKLDKNICYFTAFINASYEVRDEWKYFQSPELLIEHFMLTQLEERRKLKYGTLRYLGDGV